MPSIIEKVRPEIAAGKILRDDGEIHYYVRVNALLRPDMTVLDYGAGRGVVFSKNEFTLREVSRSCRVKSERLLASTLMTEYCSTLI